MERENLEVYISLGRRYSFEEGHARQVCRLALQLFDHLRNSLELASEDRRLLAIGALLHDIGCCYGMFEHHKSSRDILLLEELPELTRPEKSIVVCLARYHRKACPKPKHRLYGEMAEGDQRRVRRLAALLRIADALDRQHLDRIERLVAVASGKELVISIFPPGDYSIEEAIVQKKGDLLEKEMGLSPRFSALPG